MKQKFILYSLATFLLLACRQKHDGVIEGSVHPPAPSIEVTAVFEGKNVLTVTAGSQDGAFKLSVPAGVYTVNVMVPDNTYPIAFQDVVVKPEETTVLPPISRQSPPAGKAVLSGKVMPPRSDAEVKLIYEGKERAAVHTDREGRYEFKELPAGTYLVRANSPGHAEDVARVVVPENQKVEQNAVLLPISSIDGVDWAAGKIRATGVGLPPKQAENETVRRELTKRAALADAERNLLRTIEQIRLDTDRTVKTMMNNKAVAIKVRGFIRGYSIVSERESEDGTYEITLELPLNGPSGLSRLFSN